MGGKMDVQALIIWLVVGAIAGWLAGMVVKGGGYGLIGDIIVGIIGGLIAGWLLPQLGIVIGAGIVARLSTPSSARLFCCSFCAWLNALHSHKLKVSAGRPNQNPC